MVNELKHVATVCNTIDGMNDQQLNDTLTSLSVLADPLSRKIMAKLASKHSPIAVNAVPTKMLNASKAAIISRLCRLESYGLATSVREKDGDLTYNVYKLNAVGERLVKNHMSVELNAFQSM